MANNTEQIDPIEKIYIESAAVTFSLTRFRNLIEKIIEAEATRRAIDELQEYVDAAKTMSGEHYNPSNKYIQSGAFERRIAELKRQSLKGEDRE